MKPSHNGGKKSSLVHSVIAFLKVQQVMNYFLLFEAYVKWIFKICRSAIKMHTFLPHIYSPSFLKKKPRTLGVYYKIFWVISLLIINLMKFVKYYANCKSEIITCFHFHSGEEVDSLLLIAEDLAN